MNNKTNIKMRIMKAQTAVSWALAAGLFTLAWTGDSSGVSIVGALSNFDMNNDTGQPCDEFELIISNTVPSQLYGTWNSNPHYGAPQVTDLGGSTRVHYVGKAADITPANAVEHFGAILPAFPTNGVLYTWMRAGTNVGDGRQFPTPVVTIITVPPTPTNSERQSRHREVRNTDSTNSYWVRRGALRTSQNVSLDDLMTTNALIVAATNLDERPKRLRPGDKLSDDDDPSPDDVASDLMALQIFADNNGKPGHLIGNFMSSAQTIRGSRAEGIHRERDGRQTIDFTIDPGKSYLVQASDDLILWEDIGGLSTNRPAARFTDDRSTNRPARYYRLQQR